MGENTRTGTRVKCPVIETTRPEAHSTAGTIRTRVWDWSGSRGRNGCNKGQRQAQRGEDTHYRRDELR